MQNASLPTHGGWPTRIGSWAELAADPPPLAQPFELTVFRHGETTRNAERRISGTADVELTARGRQQARELGSLLSGAYDASFHSGFARSAQTLELAQASAAFDPGATCLDPRIAERSMGALEGTPSRPIPAYDDGDLTWSPPGGEPYLAVSQRVLSFLRDLEAAARKTVGLRALVSSHVGPMRAMLAIVDGTSSPAEMMTAQHRNAVPCRRLVHTIRWPSFIDPTLAGLE